MAKTPSITTRTVGGEEDYWASLERPTNSDIIRVTVWTPESSGGDVHEIQTSSQEEVRSMAGYLLYVLHGKNLGDYYGALQELAQDPKVRRVPPEALVGLPQIKEEG